MSRSTFSVLFYANKSKLKNGSVPIMGRVTINGTQSQFSCKQSIPLDLWDVKDNHARELNRTNEQHQQEVGNLKRILDKAYRWFPIFNRFLKMERECLACGFNMEQTDKLLYGHAVNYSEWLHSNEYRHNALANNVTAQVIRDEKRNLFLLINETPIAQWFMEQFGLSQKETQRKGNRL